MRVYRCDYCGKDSETNMDMFTLAIKLNCRPQEEKRFDLCRECADVVLKCLKQEAGE